MIKIYFGLLVRHSPTGGKLVCLDWDTKKVEAEVPTIPDNPSLQGLPNPRKTGQGCRGIAFQEDKVIAANYHTLKIYDRKLHHQRDISHNLFSDIHEIVSCDNDRLFVTSTGIDSILELNLKNGEIKNEYWPREMASFQKTLNLTPLEIDKRTDNRIKFFGANSNNGHPEHLHLNAVAFWQGEVFALFHAFGVIANLSRQEIVLQDNALKVGHNLIITEDGTAILNRSKSHTVCFYDIRKKKLIKTIDLSNFAWVRNLANKARAKVFFNIPQKIMRKLFKLKILTADPLFLRGLDIIGNLLFIGMSPASIVCIDWRKNEFVDAFCYSKRVKDCIHGLRVLQD